MNYHDFTIIQINYKAYLDPLLKFSYDQVLV